MNIITINLFSTWAFYWFLLYYFKFTKLNPSIIYVFLFIPIIYLVGVSKLNTSLKLGNGFI